MGKYKKSWKSLFLFISHIAVLTAVVFGFFAWPEPPTSAEQTISADEPEEDYYKRLIYAVNEINYQIEQFEELLQNGNTVPAQTAAAGAETVARLFADLQNPPEKYAVSHMIAADMHKLFAEYTNALAANREFPDSTERLELLKKIRHEYELFVDDYYYLRMLYQFKGINIICH